MFNLDYYTKQGYDWQLSQLLHDALNMWLEYKDESGYPIKSYRSVEMIIKNLNGCCTKDEQKVKLIENAIDGGYPQIRYQTPIESNGTKQQTSKTGRIDTTDLQRYINGET